MLVEAIGTPLPSPEQMRSFDCKQKKGSESAEVKSGWYSAAAQWHHCSIGNGLCFTTGEGRAWIGWWCETILPIQTYKPIFCCTGFVNKKGESTERRENWFLDKIIFLKIPFSLSLSLLQDSVTKVGSSSLSSSSCSSSVIVKLLTKLKGVKAGGFFCVKDKVQ